MYFLWLRLLLLLAMFFPFFSKGADFIACIAQLPVAAESREKGMLIDLMKAMTKVTGKTIDYDVYPFARSILMVQKCQCDFEVPFNRPQNENHKGKQHEWSAATFSSINFVLYTNKSYPVNISDLKTKIIETDAVHTSYFDFPIVASSNIEGSLRKLNIGRIDGFIFGEIAADSIIKAQSLKNIRRRFYKKFEIKAILAPCEKKKIVDRFLVDAIGKLKATGEYDKIYGDSFKPYNNWQP